MTRAEFVRTYAARSNLSDQWAEIGLIDVGSKTMLALPCGCGAENCEGWAMVTADGVLDHLMLHAPSGLREAYAEAVRDAGGKR